LRDLTEGFTRERGLAGKRYFGATDNLAAYLLYFWPVTYMQARLVFRLFLPPGFLPGAAVLDLGSGPAPASLAALDCGALRAVAADSSRAATAVAGKLGRERGKNLVPAFWDAVKGTALPVGVFKIVIMSHVINELWGDDPARLERRTALATAAGKSLAPGGILLILEPALFSVTRDLLALRDALLQKNFEVLSPCLRQGQCPCLGEERATCHADFPWNPPDFLTRLARQARLGKERLRFSFIVLRKGASGQGLHAGKNVYRVVSERMLSKSGRIRYFICGVEGRFPLSAKPEGTEPWCGVFHRLQRYDAVFVEGTEKRENGQGLTRESVLKKVNLWD
jgi:SAM-dependent methyltransferase